MEISIVACMFVLDKQENENIKKNDIKTLKILVNKKNKNLLSIPLDDKSDIKELIRKHIQNKIK